MPIGDLLAEISGGTSSNAPPPKTPTSSSLKRKADDDNQSTTSIKATKSRQQDGSYSATKITRDLKDDNTMVDRLKITTSSSVSTKTASLPHRTNPPATNGRYEPPVPNKPRSTTTAFSNNRPSTTSQARKSSTPTVQPRLSSAALAAASKAAPSRPSPTTPTATDPSKAPKKGSFQEIMERAKKAQQTMGKVGVIQHKSIGNNNSKKEQPVKTEQKSAKMKGADGKPYLGNGRPSMGSSRGATKPGAAARDAGRNGAAQDAKTGGKSRPGSSAGEVAEKKVKKSATATTGYTGTARPRPGAASGKPSLSRKGSSYNSGGLLAPPKPSRRDRYEDEYDDELDDFIEYDDDEGPGPQGYGYDSDGSSDMEAGLSDIDVEERRAEVLAREEDKREAALEEKLKREKEERRRRLGQGR